MMHEVVKVSYISASKLKLTFDDGKIAEVDLSEHIKFTGFLAPLKDEDFFKQVYINHEIGTISWPNNIDLCPDTLYRWGVSA